MGCVADSHISLKPKQEIWEMRVGQCLLFQNEGFSALTSYEGRKHCVFNFSDCSIFCQVP